MSPPETQTKEELDAFTPASGSVRDWTFLNFVEPISKSFESHRKISKLTLAALFIEHKIKESKLTQQRN